MWHSRCVSQCGCLSAKLTPPRAQLLLDIREIQRTLLELPRYSLAEEGSTAAAAS